MSDRQVGIERDGEAAFFILIGLIAATVIWSVATALFA
jgi:hypothetical protein